jgi:hypothetical protein
MAIRIIILLFVSSSLLGQYQTTNLDFLFNGSIDASDSTLIDSITGVSDPNYKLLYVDFDITLGHIPIESHAEIIIYGDTIPIVNLGGVGLRNYNDADTLFIQKQNSKITRIAHYSTPTTDINDYWKSLIITGTMLDVCPSGCTYSSIDAASAVASIGDTIIVYEGIYNENGTQGGVFVDTDSVKFIALASVKINAGGNYTTYISSADNVKFDGFEVINNIGNYCNRSVGTTTELVYQNCWFDGLTHVALSTVDNSSYTAYWNECYINDRIDYRATYQVNNSKIDGEERIFLAGVDQATATLNYCNFGETTTGAIRLVVSTPLNVNGCIFKGIVVTDAGIETGDRYFRDCNITKIDDNTPMIFDNSGGDIYIDNCDFFDDYQAGFNAVIDIVDHNVYIDSCTFDSSIYVVKINNTVSKESEFINSNINTPYQGFLELYNTKTKFNYNTVASDTGVQINVRSQIIGTKGNEVIGNDITANNTSIACIIIGSTTAGYENYSDSTDVFYNIIQGNGDHSIFVYDQKYVKVDFNHVDNAKLGVVFKARDNSMFGCTAIGNVFKDCLNWVTLRGCDSVKVFHNTGANYNRRSEGLLLFTHEDFTSNAIEGNIVNNNIFYSDVNNGYLIKSDIDANITNTDIDYNQYYHTYTDTFALSNNVKYTYSSYLSTFSKDQKSFYSDPLFKSSTQLWSTGGDAVRNGLNLGVKYKYGLNINSVWPNSVNLKERIDRWDIGAYVINEKLIAIDRATKQILIDEATGEMLIFDK